MLGAETLPKNQPNHVGAAHSLILVRGQLHFSERMRCDRCKVDHLPVSTGRVVANGDQFLTDLLCIAEGVNPFGHASTIEWERKRTRWWTGIGRLLWHKITDHPATDRLWTKSE